MLQNVSSWWWSSWCAALLGAGVSIVYALVGAWALEMESFLLAFGAAVALPGLAMLAVRVRSSVVK